MDSIDFSSNSNVDCMLDEEEAIINELKALRNNLHNKSVQYQDKLLELLIKLKTVLESQRM
jgi:hypothetical protein